MIISWSTSITNARMRKLECSLEDFMDIFKPENVHEQAEKDGPNYIAGRLLDYSLPRGKGNVIDRCAVVLDCDDADKAGIEALCDAVKNLGVRSVVHSTYSSTSDKPRVRVVIPLKDNIVPGDYVNLCKALMNRLNMVTWDESCAQAERAMYMPAKPEGGEYWAEEAEGPLMDGVEWLKTNTPAPKKRISKGNVAKRDKRRKPKNDVGIAGAFNRVYTITDAIEEFDLPYEPCRDGRWTYYGSDSQGGLRLVEGREDLCISEHANTDPACFVDGNGSVRALSAFELCAVHLYGEGDDTTAAPRERASMKAMARRAAEDEAVRAELTSTIPNNDGAEAADIAWLINAIDDTYTQAEHAADALRDRLAYVEGLGWLVYAPQRGVWEPSHESAALNCIADVVRTWYRSAVLTGDADLIKKVSRLRHVSTPRAILAHILAMLSVPVSAFNRDLDLLCVPNGVVNLRTGELLPHSPKYRMTRQTKAEYKPGATHEAWNKALQALDLAERCWLQWWTGCALTGFQPDDHGAAIPILYGRGSNGKSVLMTAIISAFGDYAHVGSQSLLMPNDGKELLRACAFLMGIRLCIIEEAPNKMIHGNALKQLAATPTMKGEFKFKSEFTFNTTHSLMVSTNNCLRFDEGTDAVVRRVAILPFGYQYVQKPSKENERPVDSTLLRELETPEAQAAILAWAVEGSKDYFAAGQHVMPATEAMEAMKNEWLAEGDAISSFFNDMLVEDPDGKVSWTHLYAAFNAFQERTGGKGWNRATFKNSVLSHRLFSGVKSGKLSTTGMDWYCGEGSFGLKVPTGGRVAGLRGVRFRTDADDVAEALAEEELVVPAAPIVPAAPVVPALIDVEDVPAVTPHVAPERDEVERGQLIEEINNLVDETRCYPGGAEEVDRLVTETGATSPAVASLGKMRALKMRLENSLIYWSTHHTFPGERAHMRE